MHQSIIATFLSLFVSLIMGGVSFAQERYLDSLFSVQMETFTYVQQPNEPLDLDIYTPQNDSETQRPLLLYVHGGGFSGGQRNGERADRFFRQLAQKGYVVATISYTLTMKGQSFSCDQPTPNKINTFRVAGNDIARATQFLNSQSAKLGIDTTQIVLAGSSAGAEAVLHAAYWPETHIVEEGALLSENFRYAGVISMAGALVSLDWVTAESAVPTQFFHGTCDNLVPYGEAPHHYCSVGEPGYMPLYGAEAIAGKLRELGKPYYLYTVCRGRHEWAGRPLANNVAEITDFLYHDVLHQQKRQLHTIHASAGDDCPDYPKFNYCE
ncbi:alpha/beta hydrolase [Tunicatimonas pelagia]|uniref:alpha/beta hydrolase n=1 Tax=Tunicatimonas pelagia TaxID=931531 RepID=UPI0026657273|nr:alpha/beta hydrolase [Tunicatimonas pelagia]WKN43715.1 alpha/beta hydrolase [Tunicatimonas pelagia]